MHKGVPLLRQIKCSHFPLCSGCTFDTGVDRPALLAEATDYFSKKGLLDFKLQVGKFEGWRYRAKLAVRGNSKNPLIGLYKEGTHQVIDIPLCRVHHPQINRAVDAVRELIKQEEIVPYNENSHLGDLRYLQLAVERETGKVQLTLVLNCESLNRERWQPILKAFWEKYDFWNSIWVNFNTSRFNTIFGKKWELVFGDLFLWDKMAETEVCFLPGSFAQANLEMFEDLLKAIQKQVNSKDVVADFYAGVGVIGLALVKKAKEVFCCEINSLAKPCFEAAQSKLSKEEQQKIQFFVGNATEFVDIAKKAHLIVVDPPRKGLDRLLLEGLKKSQGAKKLVYVSCGWSSFRRDCDELLKAGWQLCQAEAYLFFPGTDQIETLALFKKDD
jgi:23S rRNA (uracil1939-C5)-methyltransferase